MKKNNQLLQEQVVGIPFSMLTEYSAKTAPKGYLQDAATSSQLPVSSSRNKSKQNKVHSVLKRNKPGKGADSFVDGFKEHVKLRPKIRETLKGTLSLGVKILQEGGIEKIFKRLFSVAEDEKLLKACQCYLSTTAGPIAGLLFISTYKIAFRSEKSIRITSPDGNLIKVHYKVLIPLNKIKRVDESEDIKKTSEKYIEIVTVDNFDFWFMGFLNHKKVVRYFQLAIFQNSDYVYKSIM